MTERKQVFERSEKNATSKTLPYELQDIIFLECDIETLKRTRVAQSQYVKNITEYDDVDEAALNGNFQNLKWLHYKKGHKLYEETFVAASRNRKNDAIPILKWLIDNNYSHSGGSGKFITDNCIQIRAIIEHDEYDDYSNHEDYNPLYENYTNIPIDTLRWLHKNVHSLTEDNGFLYYAIDDPKFNLYRYLEETKSALHEDMCIYAIMIGDIKMMQYLYEKGCPWWELMYTVAIMNYNIEAIYFLSKHGCPYDTDVMVEAIENGNLEIVEFMYNNGFSYDEHTYTTAVQNGDIDMIRFMHLNRFPYDSNLFITAIESNRLEIVKFLYEYHYYIPVDVMVSKDMVTYRIPSGSKISDPKMYNFDNTSLYIIAIIYDNLDMVKYLYAVGFKWDEKVFKITNDLNRMDIIEFFLMNP
jgi:hypothetical protein